MASSSALHNMAATSTPSGSPPHSLVPPTWPAQAVPVACAAAPPAAAEAVDATQLPEEAQPITAVPSVTNIARCVATIGQPGGLHSMVQLQGLLQQLLERKHALQQQEQQQSAGHQQRHEQPHDQQLLHCKIALAQQQQEQRQQQQPIKLKRLRSCDELPALRTLAPGRPVQAAAVHQQVTPCKRRRMCSALAPLPPRPPSSQGALTRQAAAHQSSTQRRQHPQGQQQQQHCAAPQLQSRSERRPRTRRKLRRMACGPSAQHALEPPDSVTGAVLCAPLMRDLCMDQACELGCSPPSGHSAIRSAVRQLLLPGLAARTGRRRGSGEERRRKLRWAFGLAKLKPSPEAVLLRLLEKQQAVPAAPPHSQAALGMAGAGVMASKDADMGPTDSVSPAAPEAEPSGVVAEPAAPTFKAAPLSAPSTAAPNSRPLSGSKPPSHGDSDGILQHQGGRAAGSEAHIGAQHALFKAVPLGVSAEAMTAHRLQTQARKACLQQQLLAPKQHMAHMFDAGMQAIAAEAAAAAVAASTAPAAAQLWAAARGTTAEQTVFSASAFAPTAGAAKAAATMPQTVCCAAAAHASTNAAATASARMKDGIADMLTETASKPKLPTGSKARAMAYHAAARTTLPGAKPLRAPSNGYKHQARQRTTQPASSSASAPRAAAAGTGERCSTSKQQTDPGTVIIMPQGVAVPAELAHFEWQEHGGLYKKPPTMRHLSTWYGNAIAPPRQQKKSRSGKTKAQ